MKNMISILVLACSTLFSATALGMASDPKMTRNEWQLLPGFCMYVHGSPGHGSETQKRLFASDRSWIHMHHYCWAVVQTIRSYRHSIPRSLSNEYIRTAIGNLNYTIARSHPGFPPRRDMFVRKATLQARLGNLVAAAETARQLIAENPEIPEGYIILAEMQFKAGKSDQARETLRLGDEKVTDKARFEALKQTLPTR